MTKTRLRKYAHLIAKCGVNVQKGQEVYITAELDQPEFVKMVTDECFFLRKKRPCLTVWHNQLYWYGSAKHTVAQGCAGW